jgi:putative transposase
MGRPESAVEVAVIEAWHSTLEFELHRVEPFATRVQARWPPWVEE